MLGGRRGKKKSAKVCAPLVAICETHSQRAKAAQLVRDQIERRSAWWVVVVAPGQ